MKKINLGEFSASQIPMQQLSEIEGGDGSTRSTSSSTSCYGNDTDNKPKDSDGPSQINPTIKTDVIVLP